MVKTVLTGCRCVPLILVNIPPPNIAVLVSFDRTQSHSLRTKENKGPNVKDASPKPYISFNPSFAGKREDLVFLFRSIRFIGNFRKQTDRRLP